MPTDPQWQAEVDRAQRDSTNFVQKVRNAKLWHLLLFEDAPDVDLNMGDRIYGQFTPQEFGEDYGANVPEIGGFSRSTPLIQWVGGAIQTFTFQARLFSMHSDDTTAQDKLAQLRHLCEAVRPMNRPPLTIFFWGNAFPGGIFCLVQSLGGIKYDEIRADGTIRGVTLNITLKRWEAFRVERNVTSQMEQTPTHVVRDGETYEMIALRRYGDPMLGIPLRRKNPRFPMEKWAPKTLADLSSNETIKLYDRNELAKTRIKPESHIFDEDSRISADIRRYYFEERSKKISILPKR